MASGERRRAGKQRYREVWGIPNLSSYRLTGRFKDCLLNKRLNRRANRTVPRDLAQRTERTNFLGRVQVRSTPMFNLADSCSFIVVVKSFGRKEVDLTSEQQ